MITDCPFISCGCAGSMIAQRRSEGRSLEGLVNHYVFTGPPGTGKTTVARALGRILFAYGVTATANLVETSAPDLIGAYVGHTRKVNSTLDFLFATAHVG